MKFVAASALVIGLGLMAMSPSQAMPLSPLGQSASSNVTLVAQGCGRGYHRGPYGRCRPLYNCPPGWHTGPYGQVCVRN